jgi:arginyl-tRNA synthetase
MMIRELKAKIIDSISDWLVQKGVEQPVVMLEGTSEEKFGEYSTNVAMRYAKELKVSPVVIAQELTDYLQSMEIVQIQKVEFVPPGFVNFYFSQEVFMEHTQTVLAQGSQFGTIESHQGEKWVIEHTSPNPNKAMHLGHLRNNLVGMGLVRLLGAAGAEVHSDCVYNDRGIAIAKVMYGFLAHMKKTADTPTSVSHFASSPADWHTPEDLDMKPDVFVAQCYVQGEEDFKNIPEVEQTVRQMVVDWEAKSENIWKLWRHVLGYAYKGNELVLARLGSHWDKVWYEHEHYEKGKEYAKEGLAKGVFRQLEDGAILTNLEVDYSLPDTVLLKNDGTSLYITQDLALTDLKKKIYNADKLVWVVGPEQSMSFKQLFASCEQLGIGKVEDFSHVTYGYVGLKAADGGFQKMSSRSGTVVLIDDVIDGVKETILERFKADEKEADEKTAETLALGAVKFAFLKSDRTQDMTFDVEKSVDIHGDSGMYVLYTYVRTQSILRKAEESSLSNLVPTESGSEHSLVRSLLYFEDVIKKSVDDLSVHHIAQYLLELSSEFNSWYAKEMVLDGSVAQEYKLAITKAVGITLQNGLSILGIETVDKM